jgi:hypothetical protein
MSENGFITVTHKKYRKGRQQHKIKIYRINLTVMNAVDNIINNDAVDHYNKIEYIYINTGDICYLVYTVHMASKLDDIILLEKILTNNIKIKKILINSSYGNAGYTPLARAAYYGSTKCLKLLLKSGSYYNNLNNKHENLQQIIRGGMREFKNKSSYNDCLDFSDSFVKAASSKQLR